MEISIQPQRKFADLIIRFSPKRSISLEENELEENDLILEFEFNADIDLENRLGKMEFLWDYNEDLKSQRLTFDKIPTQNLEELAMRNISNSEELTSDIIWRTGYNGLIQYVILIVISEKLKNRHD